MPRDNLIGQKFNKLTVIEFSHVYNYGTYWICRCECGTITKPILGKCLKNGTNKTCGKTLCKTSTKNIVGKKFGKLTVIKFAYTKGNYAYWTCRCECGEVVDKCGTRIRQGLKACGNNLCSGMIKDISGQKFGKLTVLRYEKVKGKKDACWLCKCECGKEKVICGSELKNGKTKTCGSSLCNGNVKNLKG